MNKKELVQMSLICIPLCAAILTYIYWAYIKEWAIARYLSFKNKKNVTIFDEIIAVGYSWNAGEYITEYEKNIMKQDDKCPDCYGQLTAGPEAGICINAICTSCDSKFNIILGFGIQRTTPRKAIVTPPKTLTHV